MSLLTIGDGLTLVRKRLGRGGRVGGDGDGWGRPAVEVEVEDCRRTTAWAQQVWKVDVQLRVGMSARDWMLTFGLRLLRSAAVDS